MNQILMQTSLVKLGWGRRSSRCRSALSRWCAFLAIGVCNAAWRLRSGGREAWRQSALPYPPRPLPSAPNDQSSAHDPPGVSSKLRLTSTARRGRQ